MFLYTACAVEYFQGQGDGEKDDGFITLPRGDKKGIEAFLAFLTGKHPAFSEEQIQALRAVYSGSVNPRTGERIYNGMPLGSERFGCGFEECQQEESPHYYPFIWAFGDQYDGYGFDFDEDIERLNQKMASDLNANEPDLSAFEKHGGKLLIYSSSADPCVPYPDAMNYYCRVLEKMGGYQKVQSFCRYFLFPGKDHGGGGMGTNVIWANQNGDDELAALRLWREEGKAPEQMIAVGYREGRPENGISFKRAIFPFGQDGETYGKCPPACSDAYLNRKYD